MFQEFEGEVAELSHELEHELASELESELEQTGGTTRTPPARIIVRPFQVLDRFAHDGAVLTPGHRIAIRRLARNIAGKWGSGRPVTVIRLVGHTSAPGSPGYNLALGRRRAEAVATGLRAQINRLRPGLSSKIRFVVQTLGESRPVVRGARTADGHARNRRVEVFLSERPAAPRRQDPGLRRCLADCAREFRNCTGSRVDCLRALRRCRRLCQGVPV